MSYKMQDLIDVSLLQSFMDRLKDSFTFGSAIIDNEGNVLTSSGWNMLCTKFLFKTELCSAHCEKCNIQKMNFSKNVALTHNNKCPFQIYEYVIPIKFQNITIGDLFIGQFFIDEPDKDYFKEIARANQFDENEFLAAVMEIPVISQKKFEQYIAFGENISAIISGLCKKRVEEVSVIKELNDKEERLTLALSSAKQGLWELNLFDDTITFDEHFAKSLGLRMNEHIISRKQWKSMIHPEDRNNKNGNFFDFLSGKIAVYENEFRLNTISGWKWMRSTGKIFERNRFGKPIRIVGIHTDISELKQNETDLLSLYESLENTVVQRTRELQGSNEELFKSKQMLLNIIDNIPQRIFWKDKNCVFMGCNKSFANDTGIANNEDIIGKTDDDLSSRSNASEYQRDDREVMELQIPKLNFIEQLPKADGTVAWLRTSKVPLFDSSRQIMGLLGIYEDITTQKENEDALKISDRIFKHSLDMLCIAGFDGYFKVLNPAWSNTLGWTNEELLAKPYIDFVYVDDVEATKNKKMVLVNGVEVFQFENRYVCKDGSLKWLSWNSIPYTNENIVFAVARDITENKKMTIQLRKDEARLESLLRILQYKVESTQKLLDFALSEALLLTKSMYGYIYYFDEEKQEFQLNSWSNGVMKECQVVEPQTIYQLEKTGIWGEAVRQRKPIMVNDFAAFNPHKKGYPEGHVPLRNFLTLPIIKDDKIVAVIGVANKDEDYDQSDIRQLSLLMDSTWNTYERELYRVNLKNAMKIAVSANKAKSDFLANMSHEIRTPMNAILGYSELLKSKVTDSVSIDYLNGIVASGKSLLSIITDILDLSKIEADKVHLYIEPINLNSVFLELMQIFKYQSETKGVELLFEISPQVPTCLMLDEIRIRQVLLNVIGNALKFTSDGYVKLKVTVNEFENDNSKVDLCFEVQDTGIGISEDQIERIFDAFHQPEGQNTRKYGGTGLGLTITKRLVEMMDGRITVESQKCSGSVFKIYIQNVAIGAIDLNQVDEKFEEIENIKFNNDIILLVEDIESNRRVVKGFLEGYNLQIVEAYNGSEALDIALKAKPKLILMDIQMPQMDGRKAALSIRQNSLLAFVPIIALTASSTQNFNDEDFKLFNVFIQKPVSRKKLITTIAKFLKIKEYNSAPHEKTVKNNLNDGLSDKNKVEAIVNELQLTFQPQIDDLQKRLVINNIIEFSKQLQNFGVINKVSLINNYSEELLDAINSYNMDLVSKKLGLFDKLIDTLKQNVK